MKKPRTVTQLQASWCLAASIIGVGILAFPRITVEYAYTGAPIAAMAAALIVLICGIAFGYLGKEYPEKTMFEYSDQLMGKWVTGIITVVMSFYYLLLAGLTAREFGEVVVTSVLQRTPLEVTVIIMLFLAATAARSDAGVFARILTYYMPFVYFPAIIIVLLTLKSASVSNILPLLSIYQSDWNSMGKATLVVIALFQNYVILGLLTPFMYQPNKAWRCACFGIGIAGTLYVTIMYATLAVFGVGEIKNLLWPTLELAKTAALPAFFVERLDPIFLAVWVTAVFTAIISFYYVAVQGFSHVLRLKNHIGLPTILFPIIFILAMQPPNIVDLYQTVEQVGKRGIILTLGFPILMLLLHFFKKRKQQRQSQENAA